MSFDRVKDWLDIRNIFEMQKGRLDIAYIERWLNDMYPPDDSKIVRLHAYLKSQSPE